jgi:hypothetical protein
MTMPKVGISSYEEMKARTMAVARCERRVAASRRSGSPRRSPSPRCSPPATANCCASSPRRRPVR